MAGEHPRHAAGNCARARADRYGARDGRAGDGSGGDQRSDSGNSEGRDAEDGADPGAAERALDRVAHTFFTVLARTVGMRRTVLIPADDGQLAAVDARAAQFGY